jgi:crotonobetainyl-CoA:carnitine CoA-transferase CaiB-like acyl-CoA transferase
MQALDHFLHEGKRRVASADSSLVRDLASNADVLIMEGTHAALSELGWYELERPAVRVAITPFGLTGPYRDWQATASVLLAMGGYTYIMGDPGRAPLTLPGHYVQYQAGQHAYIAANALSFEGEANQMADVSMWETLLSLSQFTTVMWTSNKQVRQRHGSDFGLLYPINLFPCADGWFHVNVVPSFWGPFTRMLDRPELETDHRFLDSDRRRQNIDALDHIIVEQLGSRTRLEIMELGEQARVPTGILQEISEVLADKHLHERKFLLDVNGVKVPDIAYRYLGDLAS